MIELFDKNIRQENRQSSKGNQLKGCVDHIWYKTDFMGYEGLVEYVISRLLEKSTLTKDEFVLYETEEICYRKQRFPGCKSGDFLPEGWQLITLERLFHSHYNESFYMNIYRIADHTERLKYLVDCVKIITGLDRFGKYMSKLMTIDAMFLNEDRHMNNIAVLLDDTGKYHYCPFFDNGVALLSDTKMDYPMTGDVLEMIDEVSAKTFCSDFDEQLDVAEELYGQHMKFRFTMEDVREILDKEKLYDEEIKKRVFQIISDRHRKYRYLFV